MKGLWSRMGFLYDRSCLCVRSYWGRWEFFDMSKDAVDASPSPLRAMLVARLLRRYLCGCRAPQLRASPESNNPVSVASYFLFHI